MGANAKYSINSHRLITKIQFETIIAEVNVCLV